MSSTPQEALMINKNFHLHKFSDTLDCPERD